MQDAEADDALVMVPFPGVDFISFAEFESYCRDQQSVLDAQYLFEMGQATSEATHILAGTCAPCLRRAVFTSRTEDGHEVVKGAKVPHWREQMVCDCSFALTNRMRALVHAAQTLGLLRPSTRILHFGPETPLERWLAETASVSVRVRRLARSTAARGWKIEAPNDAATLTICPDYLQRLLPLRSTLAELRRVTAPGGSLLFTVPFRYRATITACVPTAIADAESKLEVNEIGWDILAMLTNEGFRQAKAHVFWSAELGYLGSFNTVFHAIA